MISTSETIQLQQMIYTIKKTGDYMHYSRSEEKQNMRASAVERANGETGNGSGSEQWLLKPSLGK